MHLYGFVGYLNTRCAYKQVGTCTKVVHKQTSTDLHKCGSHTDKHGPAHMYFTYRQARTLTLMLHIQDKQGPAHARYTYRQTGTHVVNMQTSRHMHTCGSHTEKQAQTYA